jgi:MFS family permease
VPIDLHGDILFVPLLLVLTYIDVAASQVGINPDIAFYLVAIANGCSALGRIASSWLAIQYGAMNVLLPFSILAGVLTWSWPYINQTRSYSGLVVLAVSYGASSGAFVAVFGTPMSHPAFGEMGDLGRRTGMLWSICAAGALFGPPISGAINTATHGWISVGWYAGTFKICVLFTPTNEFRLTARHGRIRLHGKRSINIYLPLYGARPSHWQGVTLALAIALIIRRPRIPSSKYFNLQFAMHLMHDICLCNTHHHPQISD